MNPTPEDTFSLRSLIPGVYLPEMVAQVGIGAILPVIASTATRLGADLAVAGLMVSLILVGQILADLPAGALAAKIGDRRAMLVATSLAAVGMTGAALTTSLWLLAVSVLAVGAANAVYGLARQSYLTAIAPPLMRARALSTLGGVARIGVFIGPFLGALVIHNGSVSNAYWVGVGTSILATVILFAVPDAVAAERIRVKDATVARPLLTVLREYTPVFATLGIAVLLVGAVRGARQTVLPLWGEHIGLDASTISLVFGLSAGIDMLLFYPAGKVMDRMGRLWIVIPSMAIMGVSMLLLPLTHSAWTMAAVGVLLGVGNGMGSGVMMTLGADVAPEGERAQFLGAWRVFHDAGNAAGPLVISAGAALGSIAAGVWAIGVISVGTCTALGRFVPRWSVHANRRTRRAAGIST